MWLVHQHLTSSISAVELGPDMMLIQEGIRSPDFTFSCNICASCATLGSIVLFLTITIDFSGNKLTERPLFLSE